MFWRSCETAGLRFRGGTLATHTNKQADVPEKAHSLLYPIDLLSYLFLFLSAVTVPVGTNFVYQEACIIVKYPSGYPTDV